MRFKSGLDFRIRRAMKCDEQALLSLCEQHHTVLAKEELSQNFNTWVVDPSIQFQVVVSQTGIIIGYWIASHSELYQFVIHTFYRKRELRLAMFQTLASFAEAGSKTEISIKENSFYPEFKKWSQGLGFKLHKPTRQDPVPKILFHS